MFMCNICALKDLQVIINFYVYLTHKSLEW